MRRAPLSRISSCSSSETSSTGAYAASTRTASPVGAVSDRVGVVEHLAREWLVGGKVAAREELAEVRATGAAARFHASCSATSLVRAASRGSFENTSRNGSCSARRRCSRSMSSSSFQSASVTTTPEPPAGAARTMEIGLVILGGVEVHDDVDPFDVETSCRDIGGHEGMDLARRKVRQSPLPHPLMESP